MTHQRHKDTLTVCLSGELDHHCAEQIRRQLDELIADECVKNLVFDMKGLTFMDSSGIGVLIGRYRTISRRSGKVSVKNMNTHMDRIFKLSGLYRIIQKAR